MKIVLDPQIFIYQKFGGISRYYTEIYKHLKEKNIDIECPIVYTENLHLKEYSFFKNNWQKVIELASKFSYSITEIIKRVLKQKSFRKAEYIVKQGDFDLFVPTYYDPYFLTYIGSKPFVLTVYDMINELFPQ